MSEYVLLYPIAIFAWLYLAVGVFIWYGTIEEGKRIPPACKASIILTWGPIALRMLL